MKRDERPEPMVGWCIAGVWENESRFFFHTTVRFTRREAWAAYLDGSGDTGPEPESRWDNTPQNRAYWRRRGTRPVRVIVHSPGHGRCNA